MYRFFKYFLLSSNKPCSFTRGLPLCEEAVVTLGVLKITFGETKNTLGVLKNTLGEAFFRLFSLSIHFLFVYLPLTKPVTRGSTISATQWLSYG